MWTHKRVGDTFAGSVEFLGEKVNCEFSCYALSSGIVILRKVNRFTIYVRLKSPYIFLILRQSPLIIQTNYFLHIVEKDQIDGFL